MGNYFTSVGNLSQKKIHELIILRAFIKEKKKTLSNLKKEIKELEHDHEIFEGNLIRLLKEGRKVSKGRYLINIGKEFHLPRLAWRGLFEKYVKNGMAKAQQLMDERDYETVTIIQVVNKNEWWIIIKTIIVA